MHAIRGHCLVSCLVMQIDRHDSLANCARVRVWWGLCANTFGCVCVCCVVVCLFVGAGVHVSLSLSLSLSLYLSISLSRAVFLLFVGWWVGRSVCVVGYSVTYGGKLDISTRAHDSARV